MPHPDLQTLPVWQLREAIASSLGRDGRLVLTAPTGSGKSTLVPIVLDEALGGGEIWVLEPRRLAARMLAWRVAELQGGKVGERVGFQTRYETEAGPNTRIRFVTAGILPRVLLQNPRLHGVAAVVFDEFHERSVDVDIGLGLLKRLVATERPDLRVLVMSATLDAAGLGQYLSAPVLEGKGRLYPVETLYRPAKRDESIWDAAVGGVAELLRHEEQGDILVFMPGAFEIGRTVRALTPLGRRKNLQICALHGGMNNAAQNQVMRAGVESRRVIVATNIAETSLTIPGVRHVVDSGLVRTSRFDAARGVDMLLLEPISAQAAEQRAGRAGRLGPGRCVRLWNLATQYAKPPASEAEIQRADLAPVLLTLHGLGIAKPADFPWLDAPAAEAVSRAESILRDLQALDALGQLTALGRRLLDIPAHPRVARFLLEAERRTCGTAGILAAAILSERPFMPRDRKQWQSLEKRFGRNKGPASDLLLAVSILQTLQDRQAKTSELASLGINPGAAREALRAAKHLARCLHPAGGAKPPPSDIHSAGDDIIRCMALAFPDHLARRRDQASLLCELRNGRSGELARHSSARQGQLLVAGEIRETGQGGTSGKTILDMASVLPLDWLRELFPEEFRESVETVWENRQKEARTELRVSCLGLVLECETVPGGDPEAESRLLTEYVLRNRESLRHWDDNLRRWFARVRWLANACPEKKLITCEEEDLELIMAEFCAGERRFAAVRNKPLLPFIHNAMSWQDQKFVRTMAPERVALPSGRHMRIDYDPARRPRGKARIQDLYGLNKTPVIAGGREKLLIEIQAPNFRAVQITDDLATFWQSLYPKVKKDLARRYPKHEWK